MRRLKTVVISSLMVVALLVSTLVSGCGAKLSASDSVATIGDKKLNYGVYNIAIRMSQATYDSYRYLFGNDLWSQDIQGNGSILSDNVKDNALEQFHTMMVMDAHKDEYGVNITDEDIQKINASAKAFVEKNKDAINSYILQRLMWRSILDCIQYTADLWLQLSLSQGQQFQLRKLQ